MKTLHRYLLREYISMTLAVAGALLFLFFLVDMFDRLQRYVGKYGADASLAMTYMIWKVPEIAYQVLPMAVLVGTVLSLSLMAQHRELVALRASGVALRRAFLPLAAVALALAVVLAVLGEWVAPATAAQRQAVFAKIKQARNETALAAKGKTVRQSNRKGPLWTQARNDIVRIGLYSPNGRHLWSVLLLRYDDEFRLVSRIDAYRAHWDGQAWQAKEIVARTFPRNASPTTQRTERGPLPLDLTPDDLRPSSNEPETLSLSALNSRIRALQEDGYDAREEMVEWHRKAAYPFSVVVLFFLAIPFGVGPGREVRGRGIIRGLLVGILLAVGFWAVVAECRALGTGGAIAPWVAGWLPNILFGGLGLALYRKVV